MIKYNNKLNKIKKNLDNKMRTLHRKIIKNL